MESLSFTFHFFCGIWGLSVLTVAILIFCGMREDPKSWEKEIWGFYIFKILNSYTPSSKLRVNRNGLLLFSTSWFTSKNS